ncbi:MAG: acyl-CoA synthetase, partial [Mycobacterium sp.]|nr:acyl-CoA synthetase [Mycobacterium sp.]
PKAWPRFVWITNRLPTTATNKILKRELAALGSAPEGGVLWTRAVRGNTYAVHDREGDYRVSAG